MAPEQYACLGRVWRTTDRMGKMQGRSRTCVRQCPSRQSCRSESAHMLGAAGHQAAIPSPSSLVKEIRSVEASGL